jgi:ABC-type antimicrobial peptide transport system permease subunit
MLLLIAMLSVAEGLWQVAQEDISESREDILVTSGPFVGLPEVFHGHKLSDELRADNTNISEAAPFNGGLLLATDPGNGEAGTVIAMGMIPERSNYFLGENRELLIDQMKVKFNGWFEEAGDPHYENDFTGPWTYEVMVDEILADNFDLKLGSEVNLDAGYGGNVTFRVVGTFETEFSGEGLYSRFFKGSVIMHLSELQTMMGMDVNVVGNRTVVSDRVSGITIGLKSDKRDPDSAADIAFDLKAKYPQYNFWTKEAQLEWYRDNIATARIYYQAIAWVSITIGILFVASIMIMSVNERKNEIGMMRAIGVSRRTIFSNILLESFLIVSLGALVGIIPGYFGSIWLGDYISDIYGYNRALTAFTIPMVLYAFFQLLAIGGIVSIYPAFKASRMNIQEVIRSVG